MKSKRKKKYYVKIFTSKCQILPFEVVFPGKRNENPKRIINF